MSDRKSKAALLRRSGKSYREISAELGVPLSTLSFWFRNEPWAQEIGKRLREQNTQKGMLGLAKHMRARSFALQFQYAKAKQEAAAEFKTLKKNPLFVAAISLYWGEGDKASLYNCRLTNVDPQMILIFRRFLTEIGNVPEEKIRYWLLLYPDLDESSCKDYWIEKAKIPKASFTKSIRIQGRHSTKKVAYGVGTVVFSSRYFKEKLLVWTLLLAEELTTDASGKIVKKPK